MSATEHGISLKYVAEPMPFAPEPFATVVNRFPLMLATTYELPKVQAGLQTSPAFLREHVFDFEDGTRLIASVERLDGGASVPASRQLHLSFGIHSCCRAQWLLQGRSAWVRHHTQIISRLIVARCINGDLTDRMATPKANHYWFTLPA